MKHRKYRILSILLLACLALQVVIPGAWAEAEPVVQAREGGPVPGGDGGPRGRDRPRSGPRGPHRRPGSDGGTHCPSSGRDGARGNGGAYRGA